MSYHAPTPSRLRGLLLMIGAGLCWSTGGVLVRLTSLGDGWEIVFWRSLFMVLTVAAFLLAVHRGRAIATVGAVGRWGVVTGFFLALTFIFFILALTRTTVANTLVTMSLSPFVAALFGWLALREAVPARTWAAMAAAILGMIVMVADSLQGGGLDGMLIALGVPVAFSVNLIILRRHAAAADMVPTVAIAGLISMAVVLPLALPFEASARDIGILAVMGMVQLGFGCMLMTMATRHLSAAEIGLLALLETTLGPVWAWLAVGERPSDLALVGGLLVIGALVFNEALGLARGARRAPAE